MLSLKTYFYKLIVLGHDTVQDHLTWAKAAIFDVHKCLLKIQNLYNENKS